MAIGKTDSLSGNIVSLENVLPEITEELKIKHELFDKIIGLSGSMKIEPLKSAETIMLSINTKVTVGIIKKIVKNEITVSLKSPIVPFKGDNVGIARNINNHWRLIGYGEII